MEWFQLLLIFIAIILGIVLAKYVWGYFQGSSEKMLTRLGGCDHPNCPCGDDCTCGASCKCALVTSSNSSNSSNKSLLGGDCGCGCGRNVVFISGVSGVGKSYVGKRIAERLRDKGIIARHIDQDSFYLNKKPAITLSNKTTTFNWDSEDSIDWDAFNAELHKARKANKCTIVTGFALWKDRIEETPDRHFLLEFPDNSGELLENAIIAARLKSKNFKGRKATKDALMVKEVVIPFYETTLTKLGKHIKLPAFKAPGQRRHVEEIADEICKEIDTIKSGVAPDSKM